jgi:hypothetical protein
MRKLTVTLIVLSLMAAFAGSAIATRGVPSFPRLAGAWSHAEINVTIRRIPHTLILDRGRIVQVSSSQLTLRERDGSLVVVPLSQSTIVTLGNVPATVFELKKRMTAMTMRIDGGAAVRVRATEF